MSIRRVITQHTRSTQEIEHNSCKCKKGHANAKRGYANAKRGDGLAYVKRKSCICKKGVIHMLIGRGFKTFVRLLPVNVGVQRPLKGRQCSGKLKSNLRKFGLPVVFK